MPMENGLRMYIITTTTHHSDGDKSVATSMVYICPKEANDRFRVESNNKSTNQEVKLFELKELKSIV